MAEGHGGRGEARQRSGARACGEGLDAMAAGAAEDVLAARGGRRSIDGRRVVADKEKALKE